SYEWGVTYSAMLEAAEATADPKYRVYVAKRFDFLSEAAPHFLRLHKEHNVVDRQMRQVILPGSLDDAGAMCAAMVKFSHTASGVDYKELINNYMDFIRNKEHRLADGTFARMRPQANSLWLDDMNMGIPALAQTGRNTGVKRTFAVAVRQVTT